MSDQCISTAESWLRENTSLGTGSRKSTLAKVQGRCEHHTVPQ